MNKSRLLQYALLTGLMATGSLAENAHDIQNDVSSVSGGGSLENTRAVIWERVQYVIVEREAMPRRVVLERIPEPTAPAEGAAASLRIPQPTAAPVKRQDNGQVQALSAQIQQLSISVSLASSASQSISQSAQRVQQSADQAARDNSQAISRTQSSASSAVALASQQANDRVAQASAQASSSASSQISFNLASVQSSASSAISVAQVSASSSMAIAMNDALSQIQAARAEATAVRSDASNFADQVQRNAISTTNLAIIVSTSVSGAVILTSIIVCVFLRYRRKRKEARDRRSPTPSEKDYDRPIAVRGSVGLGTSRFNPFSSGGYPTERLKLPTFSSRSVKKDEPLNFGFAMSDYSDYGDYKEKPIGEEKGQERTVMSDPAPGFRLQKPPNIKNAEAVRVIRVNSKKAKGQTVAATTAQEDPLPAYALSAPTQAKPELETSQDPVARKPIAVGTAEQVAEEKKITAVSKVPTEAPQESRRDTITELRGRPRESTRYTMLSDASTEPPTALLDTNRYTMMSEAEIIEEPGWRPPSSRMSRANSFKSVGTAQRPVFPQPSEAVPEPVPAGSKETNKEFSMGGVSSLLRSDSANVDSRQPTIPKLPNGPKTPKGPKAGPSFTTFPAVRSGPPSVLNRPRPAMVGKVRQDVERRLKEKEKELES